MNRLFLGGVGLAVLALGLGCSGDDSADATTLLPTSFGTDPETETGDGDGDPGDGDPGDGDPGDPAVCGDGVVEGEEECDDGNMVDTDACTSACFNAACGDGFVHEGVEACDDGNAANGDGCTTACEVEECGDGVVVGDEQCDDGNSDTTDECPFQCKLATCGDTFVWSGVETCDDGNLIATDFCTSECLLAACGDGFIYDGVEECDDGNIDETDDCTTECMPAACGDGFIQAGVEECDDGNVEDTDACLSTCVPNVCGDGFQNIGVEECDDGNMDDNDYCSNSCISSLWFPSGVQQNVPPSMMGGWTECWSSTYNQSGLSLNTILNQNCTGTKLAMACRQVGGQNYTVVAMGDRADVLFDVGNQNAGKHEANGVAWYYSGTWSWGFARGGDPVARNSCDTQNTNASERLCWHTSASNINGGYRCGATTGLNSSAQWERKLFHVQ